MKDVHRILPVVLFLACFEILPINSREPQQVQSAQTPVVNQPREASEVLLSKTVVQITTYLQGSGQAHGGTGFLVSVGDPRLPAPSRFGYLVTNRHVAEAIFKDGQEDCKKHAISHTFVTTNLSSAMGGTRAARFLLQSTTVNRWYFPDDPGVDLAAAPFGIPDSVDAISAPIESLLTAENWKTFGVTPGDKVLTIGFFRLYTGAHQFQPMIRQGILAMVPDDTMNLTLCQPAKVYLADLHVIPGNSGSPVFLGPKALMGGLIQPSNGGVSYLTLGLVADTCTKIPT